MAQTQKTRQLNREQQRAVEAIEGPVMVLAGPGTGKTQVLAARVANILQHTQMDPWNILCLTFTESGVVAMRERLTIMIGPAAYRVRVHTFHGFCNDLIQEFPEKFARAARWDILADVERVEVLRAVIDSLSGSSPLKPFGDAYLFLPDIAQALRKLKQEDIAPETLAQQVARLEQLERALLPILEKFFGLKPGERSEDACEDLRGVMVAKGEQLGMQESWLGFLSALFDRDLAEQAARTKLKNDLGKWFSRLTRHMPRQRELIHVYERYQAELTSRGRYDYEDMIMAVVARLAHDDELLAHCQEQFQYILVDEYQDTNSAQNEFLERLGGFMEQPNIFVVGDDRQSIFRFQGASLENIRFFYNLFKKDATVISLKVNYRSQATILAAAQAVIQNNRELAEKYIPEISRELVSKNGRFRETIQARIYSSDESERFGVAREIRHLIDAGAAPREIAVLYRFNREATPMHEALASVGVPARVETPEDALADKNVQQVIQILRYLSAPAGRAEELLADIIQYRFWKFRPLALVKLLHQAGAERRSLFAALNESPEFKDLAEKLAQWQIAATAYPLHRWVDIILKESGWLDWLLGQPDHNGIIVKLGRVLEELRRLNYTNHRLTAREFVQRLDLLREHNMSLPVDVSESSEEDGRVRLMTAHKAKGLEFEHVFIIQVADRHWGNIPSREKLPLPHGLLRYDVVEEDMSDEDERRLFYVAMTRARQGLHISYARAGQSGRQQVPAVFWQEIPAALKQEQEVLDTAGERADRLVQLVHRPLLEPDDRLLREWLSRRLKTYAMSVTHLNNYLECPRLFYYRNLLQVPQAKTKHQAFGTAVHAALRDFFGRLRRSKTLPNEKYLRQQFAWYLKREILTIPEYDDSLTVGEAALKHYYQRCHTEFSANVLTEYNFARHGILFQGLRLTGKLDKVEILDEKKKLVNIVDYKTGNPDKAGKYLKKEGKYFRQLVFYKLLTELSPRFEYEMQSGEIDFIQASKRTGKLVKKKFEISHQNVKDLQATIQKAWQEIQDLKFLDPALACGECEYCRRHI